VAGFAVCSALLMIQSKQKFRAQRNLLFLLLFLGGGIFFYLGAFVFGTFKMVE